MRTLLWSLVAAGWFAWLYPFLFRAPHRQRRSSITTPGPTRAGLSLHVVGVCLSFAGAQPELGLDAIRAAAAVLLASLSVVTAWQAVRHLGRQFRINAGLYEDHELVRTGPYTIVRHPMYSSLLGMLIATWLFLRTAWPWAALALAFSVAGTEIRARAEDRLLESRFEESFRAYRKAVSAYIPFVR